MFLDKSFRFIPILIMVFVFMSFVLFKSKYWLYAGIGLIFNGILWLILTNITHYYLPQFAKRPNIVHCGYIENGKSIDFSGMPSGHAQTIGFISIWVILYMMFGKDYININTHPILAIIIIMISIYSIIGMIHSRAYYYKCHTVLQASVGSLIGMISALLLWQIY